MFDLIAVILLYSIFILSPIIFISLFFITAPYGRHVNVLQSKLSKQAQKKTIGKPTVLLSKRIGWLIMESPAVITIFILWCISDIGIVGLVTGRISITLFLSVAFFIFIWEFHYIYRTFIVTYLSNDESNKFRLYVPLMGVVFNIINGYINGWYLFFKNPFQNQKALIASGNIVSFFTSISSIVGILLFFIGFYIHVQSDRELRRVKKNNHRKYGIPHRFLHKYIASPNYLGEIIQWWGWALLTGSIAGVAFALFTMANLVPRAFSNLRWYRNVFPEYPASRKAIVPFII